MYLSKGQVLWPVRQRYISALLTHYRPTMPFGDRKKNILEDLFSSVLSQLKKYHPSGNLKFNYIGISQSLKLRILVGKSF